MTPERELEILRAEMKRRFRKEGISLDGRATREIGQRTKDINDSGDLKVPLTIDEATEIYMNLVGELASEHFAQVSNRIPRTAGHRRIVPGGKPGGAFQA